MYDPFVIGFMLTALAICTMAAAARHRRMVRWRKGVIERLDALTIVGRLLLHSAHHQEDSNMATKETVERLTADVQANTDATLAAASALSGLVASVTELTQELQDAIETGDETAIAAAADAIEANNAALAAAIPALAKAVTENTKAAAAPDA